ncbi:flagellar hook-basal body complex protein [Microvirga arvi]|uniref:flagellar hook-basal body complex protein n=1 Tax=Microvirga arvi TaxID=2778731 RepID=UPI003FD7C71E
MLTSTDITGNTNITSSFYDLDGGGVLTKGAAIPGVPAVRGQVNLPVANLTTGDEIRFSVGGGEEQIFKVTAETTVDALIVSLNAATVAGSLTGIEASKDPVTGRLALISTDLNGGTDVTGTFTDIMPVSKQSSLQVFDNVGNPVRLDLALSKTGVNTWSIAVSHDATLLAGPHTLTFDANGQVIGEPSITFPLPNGGPFTLDMTGMTQLAGDYTVTGSANGNPPSNVKDVEFSADGTVYAVYEDGTRVGVYALALATVPSPDNLAVRAGNVYEATGASGTYQVGLAQTSGFGSVQSGALEGSNVDLGAELTAMIEAQTSYTANSKVFQTGSELLDVLMNLSR